MLKQEVVRKGDFTQIPKYIRKQVVKTNCQICFQPYGRVYTLERNVIRHPRQVLHHLLPRRWLNEHGISEHHVGNLLSICQYDHAALSRIEDRLWQGDLIGFLSGMKQKGVPVERVIKFALSVGLQEFRGLNV